MTSSSKILAPIFLLFIVFFAQTNKCHYCKKEIKGKYLQAEGKKYHPDHFLCNYCHKPIKSSYVDHENEVYHQYCFNEFTYQKCDVCNEALIGSYIIDSHGNEYHQGHEREYKVCDICGRIITPKVTKGGIKLSDGRNQCSICKKESIKSNRLYQSYLSNAINKLRGLGVKIDSKRISIKPTNRIELKKVAGSIYSKNMKGFCNSNLRKDSQGRLINSKHTIYILDKMPPEYTESIIAHELFHAWLRDNTNIKHSSQLEEGSCNYISYQVMKNKYTYNSKIILKNIENDPSRVYGEGFRKVKRKFNGKYLVELLNYLKKYDSI